MTERSRLLLIAFCLLALSGSPFAQLTPAKDDRIIFGHLHLHPTSLDAHKKFWNETLGGQGITFGGNIQAMKFPLDWTPTKGLGPTINLTSSQYTTPPTGGTKGTTVNHVGFGVPDLAATVARAKAAGYVIEKDSTLSPEHNAKVALLVGPDDIAVELVEVRTQKTPIAMHHIHFASSNAKEMAAWYEKVFSAKASGSKDAAVYLSTLTFETTSAPLMGTKGTSLDHIGFE